MWRVGSVGRENIHLYYPDNLWDGARTKRNRRQCEGVEVCGWIGSSFEGDCHRVSWFDRFFELNVDGAGLDAELGSRRNVSTFFARSSEECSDRDSPVQEGRLYASDLFEADSSKSCFGSLRKVENDVVSGAPFKGVPLVIHESSFGWYRDKTGLTVDF